jgi:hypothetical protein
VIEPMDVGTGIIATVLILIVFFGLPIYPYGKIGKKIKKGYTWSSPIINLIYYRYYIKSSLAESFFYYVEEFENFVSIGTLAFPNMYRELLEKTQFSQIEKKGIDKETEEMQTTYWRIQRVPKLKRKKVFKQTVKDFKEFVEDTSKMARMIREVINTKNISLSTLGPEFISNYEFSAKEFNNFLRYFRRFLDKTNCQHGVEIEQYRLMQLFIPERLI